MSEQAHTDNTDKWHIYIIENRLCQLYTGITTDVERRFKEHQQGGCRAAKALRGKGPLKLRFSQQAGSRRQALQLEYQLKKLNRQQKLALIEKGKISE